MVWGVVTRRIEGPAILSVVDLGNSAYNGVEVDSCSVMGPGHGRIETGNGTVAVVGGERHG